jgi:hypothetical protein
MLKILGAVLAVALGLWLGRPRRFSQRVEDIEDVMSSGTGRRRKVKRRFTPMAWLHRQASARSSGVGRARGFQIEDPKDR